MSGGISHKVRVTVKEIRGKCEAGFKAGDEILFIGDNVIKGQSEIKCIYGINAIWPLIHTLAYGGKIPKASPFYNEKEDAFVGCCPDSDNPVIFKIKREGVFWRTPNSDYNDELKGYVPLPESLLKDEEESSEMSDSKETGELEFDRKAWFNWKKLPMFKYGQNRARLKVKEITNIVPSCKKSRKEWSSWKKRECDAGFIPGQEMEIVEGKKLIEGEIHCFEAIARNITCIWGMAYDAWFPWGHRKRSGQAIENEDGTIRENIMLGYCPDMTDTVVLEIEKINKSKDNFAD